MKIARIHTIDVELANKLQQEDNASRVVNELLTAHYSSDNTISGIIGEIDQEDIEKAEHEEKMAQREIRVAEKVKRMKANKNKPNIKVE